MNFPTDILDIILLLSNNDYAIQKYGSKCCILKWYKHQACIVFNENFIRYSCKSYQTDCKCLSQIVIN